MSFLPKPPPLFLAVMLTVATTVFANAQESRMRLWEIVHDQCLAGQERDHNPAPCVEVDTSNGADKGYIIMPDRNGVAQFLLIPTWRISGIESANVLEPAFPDYWDAAWRARHYVFTKLKQELPRNAIGLAINSALSRSQDQFHIHIDCVAPDIDQQFDQHMKEIGPHWSRLNFDLNGKYYRAKRIEQSDLRGLNLFADMATALHIPQADMGKETLVVIGATFEKGQDGFIVLEDHADPTTGSKGHGEDLLDSSCAIADDES